MTLGFVSGRTPPPFFRRIQSNFAGKTLNRFLVADVLMERQVYSTRRENRKYALDLPVSLMGRMDCDPVSSRSIFRKRGEEETGEMKSMARFRSLHVQERNLWIKEESIIIVVSYFHSQDEIYFNSNFPIYQSTIIIEFRIIIEETCNHFFFFFFLLRCTKRNINIWYLSRDSLLPKYRFVSQILFPVFPLEY